MVTNRKLNKLPQNFGLAMVLSRAVKAVKQVLGRTPAEVLFLGLMGLAVAGSMAYANEAQRTNSIPVGYSEIRKIEKAAPAHEIGPMTRYLTSLNDICMDIFDAWNISHRGSGSFASELEYKLDPAFKISRDNLGSRLKGFPAQADSALSSISGFADVLRTVKDANSDLEAAWDYSRVDITHTEYHEVTDSEGNVHMEIREVYDYTIHTFTYDKGAGEAASLRLDRLKKDAGLRLAEKIATAHSTSADEEYAAEKSRDPNARLGQDALRAIANTWNTGSTLVHNLPATYHGLQKLSEDADSWRAEKASAKSTKFRSTRRQEDGPVEYRTVKQAREDGLALESAVGEFVGGIQYAGEQVPVLESKIKEYLEIQLDGKKGDGKKLQKDIMNITKELYQRNFKNGFEVDRFRLWLVALLSLAGAAGGAVVGFGLDIAGDKFRWYGRS